MPGTYISPTETGLYYLQSRYYDPEIGRFINADVFPSTGQGFTGNNMFAYCNNNAVNLLDYAGMLPGYPPEDYAGWIGEQIGKLISDWLTGNGYNSSSRGTVSIGVSGIISGGWSGMGSISVAADSEGNIGFIATGGGGGGLPGGGFSGFVTVTNAREISDLEGRSSVVGGSANILGASIGGEYQIFNDSETDEAYHGGTLSMGGVSSFPVETHGGVTWSKMLWSFNMREWWNQLWGR